MEKMNEQVGRMEKQLKDWRVKLDDFIAKADKGDKNTKNNYYKQIDNLKSKYHVAQSKLEETKKGGHEKWEGLRTDIEHTWKDVEKTFGEIRY